jgi:hypothetical protein
VAYWSSIALAAVDIVNIIPESKRQQLLMDSKAQAPFARQLVDCHDDLLAQEIPCGENGLMPLTIADFWGEFSVERPHGLQRILCHKIISNNINTYIRDPSTGLKATQRILSASSRNAGAWLTCYPSYPELQLSDEDYCYAAKLRLGLPCQEYLPEFCTCGARLQDDPAHFLSCSKLKASAMTTRHDWIVTLLAKLLRGVGAVVRVEPRIFGADRKRPDLDILFPNRQLLVDVTVAHPAAPSRKSRTRLAAATAAEAKKHRQYDSLAKRQGASLVGFAVETYGGFGKEADEFMDLLRQSMSTSSVHWTGKGAAEALGVCLQRGNALVVKSGALAARAREAEC